MSPEPGLVIIHDGYVESAYNELTQLGYRRIARPERVMFVTDHEVAYATPAGAMRGSRIRKIAREWGVGRFFDAGRGGHGHIFPIEAGLVRPGMFLSCYDMHCTNFGAVGALATAPGPEIVSVLATGTVWEQVPATIRLALHGTAGPAVTARDVGFYVTTLFAAGRLPPCDNRIVEFAGDYVDTLPLSERVALCNSLTEIGVANVWFTPPGSSGLGGTVYASDPDASYEAELEIDVAAIAPQVALPGGPHLGVDIGQVAGRHVDHAYIGSCGSGMYEDFAGAARLLRDHRIASHVRMFVVPGTVETSLRLGREGLLEIFQQAGAMVLPPGCGPCAGGVMGPLADGETSISTAATNHAGRFGSKQAQAYLGSPLTVAASAIAGHIADPRAWLAS
ncbi:MAG: aconitase family protein [Pigmentiphaga sp.]|uniref:3-isopropylmalate dehydratase large subunit n=1 Tax=Pigmentiphaga sp. TaxID=1977564 RepID=UPI0029B5A236|nr:aconitase family protein [Pigmentiphaga sp.]MDX3906577.1 aconitase family protein [Pigmentiphaga sp.]